MPLLPVLHAHGMYLLEDYVINGELVIVSLKRLSF